MGHHKGLPHLSDEYSVLALALEGFLVVLDGLLRLLDVHERGCHQLEIFHRALCVQDLQVASRVVVSVFQFVKVDLRLFFLCLNKTTVIRLYLLKHIKGLFSISHLQRKVRLRQHDSHFFRSSREFTNSFRYNSLCSFEVFLLTEDLDKVQKDTGTLFLTELLLELCPGILAHETHVLLV